MSKPSPAPPDASSSTSTSTSSTLPKPLPLLRQIDVRDIVISSSHDEPSEVAPSTQTFQSKLDPVDDETREAAAKIVKDVMNRGEVAFREHAHRLGDLPTQNSEFLYSKREMKEAFESLSQNEQDVLCRVRDQIRSFALAQKQSLSPKMEVPVPGGVAGHTVSPVKKAGCYAPGGNYPLPSSVMMTAITAKVAGVEQVIVASPKPQKVTLAAAYVSEADCLIGVGGAQVIAALAYGGVKGIGASGDGVDIIVGPGNRWVTAAKQVVSSRVGIDMLAGPSECLVIADETGDASIIASDLLAQAEHDMDATPILVTTSKELMVSVQKEVERQLKVLPTADTARGACEKGFAVVVPDIDTAIKVSDKLAPEHLEVMTKDSREVAFKLSNYGGLFIGAQSAEVFGDYGTGPNHVLPTSGTARFSGGLSVFTFLRIRTFLHLDENPSEQAKLQQRLTVSDAALLARLEGLEGHARAAEARASSSSSSSPNTHANTKENNEESPRKRSKKV